MNIYCLGDSLTEGDYGVFGKTGIANVKAENYPYFLSKYLNVRTYNYGKCGYTPSDYYKYYCDGNVVLDDADIVIIMLGTNGGLNPDFDTCGDRDFCSLVLACHRDAPTAKLAICTPPHVTTNPQMSNCGYAERVDRAIRFINKFAARLSANIIDVAACREFTSENECKMQPNDGLHFSELGYKTMAKFIGDSIKKLYPQLF